MMAKLRYLKLLIALETATVTILDTLTTQKRCQKRGLSKKAKKQKRGGQSHFLLLLKHGAS